MKTCLLCGVALQGSDGETTQLMQAAPPPEQLYLHCFVCPPLLVPRGKAVTIGRVDGNDIVLPARVVSRRHARVSFLDGTYQVRDLGSANGTHLNGHRVTGGGLYPGDEIRIGSFIITCWESPEISTTQGEVEEGASLEISPASGGSQVGFAGKLEEMELGEIVSVLEKTGKTGVLQLRLDRGSARICFKDGQIVHAQHAGQSGQEAFLSIYQRKEGTFDFQGHAPLLERTIDIPTASLLLEAARLTDEGRRQ